jgi:hypothetical protein
MSWYKFQGDIRYIIQFLCKSDLEEMIVKCPARVPHENGYPLCYDDAAPS